MSDLNLFEKIIITVIYLLFGIYIIFYLLPKWDKEDKEKKDIAIDENSIFNESEIIKTNILNHRDLYVEPNPFKDLEELNQLEDFEISESTSEIQIEDTFSDEGINLEEKLKEIQNRMPGDLNIKLSDKDYM